MTELQIYHGVKMRAEGDEIGLPPNSAELQKVVLWDLGPEKPRLPQRPALPGKGREGDPEHDLAVVEFRDSLAKYEVDLKEHGRLKLEFEKWEREINGPIELEFWSVDAFDALQRDEAAVRRGSQSRRRYFISTSTRGYSNIQGRRGLIYLPNRGLPEGMAPGRGQDELIRRRAEQDGDLLDAMRADPVFGEAH